MADTLKFGPEWLRALSDGNSVGTPPPSPGFGKYKLAEYRYGREEMLALYPSNTEMPIPPELEEAPYILVEKPQQPLALIPLSEEEQRILSQSVNSPAVLRLMGRGAPPSGHGIGRGVGVGVGGGERGRGRGRGRGDGFPQRGYDEEGSGFGRPVGYNSKGDGWVEAGSKRFERKEFQRSLSASDNWREREEEAGNMGNEEGDWRRAGPKWSRGNWREQAVREVGFEGYVPRSNGTQGRGAPFDRSRNYQRSRSSESWDEDNLPEWSMPDSEDVDEVGTFDSSGAFVSNKVKPKEKDEERDKGEDMENPKDAKQKSEKIIRKEENLQDGTKADIPPKKEPPPPIKKEPTERKTVEEKSRSVLEKETKFVNSVPTKSKQTETVTHKISSTTAANKTVAGKVIKLPNKSAKQEKDTKKEKEKSATTTQDGSATKGRTEAEDEALERMKREAESMVEAMTMEKEVGQNRSPSPGSIALPPDDENAMKWLYRDPQGDLQGPFTSSEMAEWFSAGYFTMNLMVKRGCDERFSALGELIKRWGRVPFLPGQAPPPLLNNPVNPSLSPDISQQQQEQMKMMQQQFLFQQQLLQQQLIMRHIQMQQVSAHLQENEQFKALPVVQQQQLAMQLLLKQHQMLLPQQDQAGQPPLNVSPSSSPAEGASEGSPPTSQPAFHRSLSQPADMSQGQVEEGSVWGSVSPVGAGAWSQPNSVWDLESSAPAAIPSEVLEKISKEKMEIDRHKKQAEDGERKRQEEIARQQEELRKQQEELKRQKDEMERQRQDLERQRQLELQRLEEARKQQEEEERMRKLMEEEQQRRKKEEELHQRQQEEAMKRRQEEEMRRRNDEMRQQEKMELERQSQSELRQQQELEKQRQQEIQRRQEMQIQQEQQRQQQEALRKLQQEQMSKIQLPSHAQWANQPISNGGQQKAMSLLEIQQQEEIQKRQQEEEQKLEQQRQQYLAMQQQQQQQQQKSWAAQKMASSNPGTSRSLLEIQEEQARQLEREQECRQQEQMYQAKTMNLAAAGVWSGSSNANWAQEGAWGNALRAQTDGGPVGFWEEPSVPAKKSKRQSNTGEFPVLSDVNQQRLQTAPSRPQPVSKSKSSKAKKEEEAVQRLFQAAKPVDGFTQWCETVLTSMATSVDIPTFIAFLQEVESPYEVHDYVRSYLGESKMTQDFAKQFLEKRSENNKKNRPPQPAEMDSIWGPAPAITPRELRTNIHSSEVDAQKNKNKKKKKMMKMDPNILGFTVQANSDRVNAGQIDIVDGI